MLHRAIKINDHAPKVSQTLHTKVPLIPNKATISKFQPRIYENLNLQVPYNIQIQPMFMRIILLVIHDHVKVNRKAGFQKSKKSKNHMKYVNHVMKIKVAKAM